MEIGTNDKEITQNVKHIHPDVKELPRNVKILHPECVEFIVARNGACCLNCLAAFIYLDPKEGPTLGRDLNTHIATYRRTYLKRLIFPQSVTIGNGKVLSFEEGEEDNFFDTLVESKECSFMWRGCVDVVAMCNLTRLNVDIDIFDLATGKVVERQSYKPDEDFPWLEEDANKPSKLFSNQNISNMKLINYKDSHFNLIAEKDHLLISKSNIFEKSTNQNCYICQKSCEANITIKE